MGKGLNETKLDKSPLIPSLLVSEVKINDFSILDSSAINDLGEKLSKRRARMLKQFEEEQSKEKDVIAEKIHFLLTRKKLQILKSGSTNYPDIV
ncbi:hypothetical protein NPIL_335871 [Nephila pilipes]|uniref:Uncharacterized protein n=1 Tax=Nephila pilipes TaxID=299642 RepID=A0A8X6TYI6_NEPPI|nr:hypothetical protein NPIL_335871 [Nephila pilipes]